MKKSLAFILFFFLLSNLSAIALEVKEKYSQGETIIAKISGNFPEGLFKEDISFYRGNVRIPMGYALSKIQEDYYLYADLFDKSPGNYTIALEKVKTQKAQKIIEEDIFKNFTITNDTADFSLNKGFVITEDDFSVKVMNLIDKKINISYSYLLKGTEEISVGETKEIKFSVKNAEFLEINILEITSENTKYEIPVYVLGTPAKREIVGLSFDSKELLISLDINNKTKRIIYLKNNGTETALQVRLSLSENLEKYMVLSKNEFSNLSGGLLYPIEIMVVSPELPKKINGSLIASSSGSLAILNISLNFIPGYIESEKDKQASSVKSCSEMNGTICESEKCTGEYVITDKGACCFGVCGEEQSTSSSWKTIGWFMLILIIAFVLWVYFQKYRKAEGSPHGIFKILKRD